MMKLGFNTRGTETHFEMRLRDAITNRSTMGFRYLECGIAEGTTLKSVAEVIRSELPTGQVQAVGIDLFDGPFFNERNFLRNTSDFNVMIEHDGRGNRQPFIKDRVDCDIRVVLLKSGEKRAMVSPGCVNFALIDGCHGAPCVEKDFLAIEAGIAPGGVVAFHDAGSEDQGIHLQQHCQMPISVLNALFNLGLLAEHSPQRPGWRFIGHVDGDKSPGNLQDNGHGFKFFQKIAPEMREEPPNPNNKERH